MTMKRVLSGVGDDDLAFVTAMLEFDGATVEKTQEPEGNWTVVGIFADELLPASAVQPGAGPPPVGERSVAIDTLARTLWGEARGEGEAGLEAVAAVVVNRTRRSAEFWWGHRIEDVCRRKFQFSCWNENDPNLPKLKKVTGDDLPFETCVAVATRAVDGLLADSTGGATHYHHRATRPNWATTPCARIGSHLFYNDVG